MSLHALLLFIPACFALNMVPGPNNLLSISNASRFGFLAACAAGMGRLPVFAVMIAIAASGLAVVLQTSEWLFLALKVFGAIYLLYMAVQLWRAPATGDLRSAGGSDGARPSLWRLARQECLVAAGNPKAILIFTAFLPQFVSPAQPAMPQFMTLGLLFLLLELIAIGAYATMGTLLGRWFSLPGRKRLFNRVCSGLLGLSGLGLLLSRR